MCVCVGGRGGGGDTEREREREEGREVVRKALQFDVSKYCWSVASFLLSAPV